MIQFLPGEAGGRVAQKRLLAGLGAAGTAFFGRFGRLSEIQSASISVLLAGQDALLSSPTASGKTEAVAAPLARRLLDEPAEGLRVLYVTPTRALANDLQRRLLPPLEVLGLSLGVKTSDHAVSGRWKIPTWVLTTPESLDSMLVRRAEDLIGVRGLVLDEIHLLDGTPRGDQLRMLVGRLRRLVGTAVRRDERSADAGLQTVLLSATSSNPQATVEAFAPGAKVIAIPSRRRIDTRGVRFGSTGGLPALLRTLPLESARKLLVFTRSRGECEEAAAALAGHSPFHQNVFAHHGSLSRRARLNAEQAFHGASRAVFVATTTLEIGIDVGDVDWVVQLGAPGSVTSFLQQIGRGCRRDKGLTRVMGIARSRRDEAFFEVILTEARAGRLEPPTRVFAASAMAQQAASYLLQRKTSTVSAPDLLRLLEGTLPTPSGKDLREVLSSLCGHGVLTPVRGGRYTAGPKLERWFESDPRRLHSNFARGAQIAAVVDAETLERLGEVQSHAVPASGTMTFGGRRGRLVHAETGRIYVKRDSSAETQAPSYRSPRMPTSLFLAQAVRSLLGFPAKVVPAVVLEKEKVLIFPFLGDAGNRLLAAHLRRLDHGISRVDDLALMVDSTPPLQHLRPDDAALERGAAVAWKSLESLQEPGGHAGLVSDALRRKQVVDRLRASGVFETIARFAEVRLLEDAARELLEPFL